MNTSKKSEKKVNREITPTTTNKKMMEKQINGRENNPCSLLGLDDNSDDNPSSLMSLVGELTVDTPNSTIKQIIFPNNTLNQLVDDTSIDIVEEDEALTRLRQTEISFDQQYDEIFTSIASNELDDQTIDEVNDATTYDHIEITVYEKVTELGQDLMSKLEPKEHKSKTNWESMLKCIEQKC